MTIARTRRFAVAGAAVVPFAIAAALIPLRDTLAGTNIALLLVVVVVAFASTGYRAAAFLAAASAAVGFNFFHTVPYLSLRIDTSDDVETTVLLLVVGLAVGEIAVRGRRARALASQGAMELQALQGLGALVAEGEDPGYVLLATSTELTHLLGLVDCRFEGPAAQEGTLPVVDRHGSVRWGPTEWDTARWGLPSDGAAIPVWSRGRLRGRFVLRAPIGLPVAPQQLAKAVALVDQAGAALAARAESS